MWWWVSCITIVKVQGTMLLGLVENDVLRIWCGGDLLNSRLLIFCVFCGQVIRCGVRTAKMCSKSRTPKFYTTRLKTSANVIHLIKKLKIEPKYTHHFMAMQIILFKLNKLCNKEENVPRPQTQSVEEDSYATKPKKALPSSTHCPNPLLSIPPW